MSKVVVYHMSYGCDTGCCGHVIEVDDEEVRGSFTFAHPYSSDEAGRMAWAREFVQENLDAAHAADLDWENSYISDD